MSHRCKTAHCTGETRMMMSMLTVRYICLMKKIVYRGASWFVGVQFRARPAAIGLQDNRTGLVAMIQTLEKLE
jgi:hypothetical protein